jgi:hypothetical protein
MKYLYITFILIAWFSIMALISSLQGKIDNASNEYAKYLIEQTERSK